jgi:UDP-N-acetylglucosamine 1-carboxyvinyltransferase
MDTFVIEGGVPLKGSVTVGGSKNASLPILFATLLLDEKVVIDNVPRLRDIHTTNKLLDILGCDTEFTCNTVTVTPRGLKEEAPYDLVRTMRASVLCLGPLLAKLGTAKVAMPGGCAIGARPVDMHLKAFEEMGATFELDAGYIHGKCEGRLRGAHIMFDFPTVGGTENVLMGAVLADGVTEIDNAAREPEIIDLANFLNACGAKIEGQGTSFIRVEGVELLNAVDYRVMPDRIEAGTYLCAAVITNGELMVKDCPFEALDAVAIKLRDMGALVEELSDGVLVRRKNGLHCSDVTTLPYPGFPTDMQAQIMSCLAVSQGSGVVSETIFENRFMHVQELARLGANIKIGGRSAVVRGVEQLKGAPVMVSDLRAGASLVLAGLAAKGTTEVRRIYHLDRGYEEMEKKLEAVGAKIKRAKQQD